MKYARFGEICSRIAELERQNDKLRKERDYWETEAKEVKKDIERLEWIEKMLLGK